MNYFSNSNCQHSTEKKNSVPFFFILEMYVHFFFLFYENNSTLFLTNGVTIAAVTVVGLLKTLLFRRWFFLFPKNAMVRKTMKIFCCKYRFCCGSEIGRSLHKCEANFFTAIKLWNKSYWATKHVCQCFKLVVLTDCPKKEKNIHLMKLLLNDPYFCVLNLLFLIAILCNQPSFR